VNCSGMIYLSVTIPHCLHSLEAMANGLRSCKSILFGGFRYLTQAKRRKQIATKLQPGTLFWYILHF